MAKKPSKRRGGRLIKGHIDIDAVLDTLAGATGILDPTDVVDDRSFLLSVEATYTLNNLTAGQGPLDVYLAHSDYTLAEVEEFIELQTGWGDADEISKEIGRRRIRHVGAFSGVANEEVMNDGKPIKTPIRFVVNEGQGLNVVTYNDSGSILTTGAAVRIKGHCWIKPV